MTTPDVEFDPVYAATRASIRGLRDEFRAVPANAALPSAPRREQVADELTQLWLEHQRAQDALQAWCLQQLAEEMQRDRGRFYAQEDYYQRGDAYNTAQARAAVERTDEYARLREVEFRAAETHTRAQYRYWAALRDGGAW